MFDFIFDKIIFFPTWISEGKSERVQKLCLAWQVVWFFPAYLICIIPLAIIGLIEKEKK